MNPTPWTLARRAARMNPSVIREILKITEKPGIISFAGGFPDSTMFDVDGIQAAVTMAEGLVRLKPRKALAGTFRRPGPKDSTGLAKALADVIAHRAG